MGSFVQSIMSSSGVKFVSRFRQRSILSLLPSRQLNRTLGNYPSAVQVGSYRAFFTSPMVYGKHLTLSKDPIDTIEDDLSQMLSTEIEATDDGSHEIFTKQIQEWMQQGYHFDETADMVTLKKEEQGRSVCLSWDPSYNPPNPSFHEEEFGVREDLEEDDAEEIDRIPVDIVVEKSEGKTLHLEGSVQNDSFTIYKIGSSESFVDVADLNEDLQVRIYDYLQGLGIGDNVATMIEEYNRAFLTKRYVNSVSKVNEFFSK